MRRFFIAIGVPRPGKPLPDLPAVAEDVRLLRSVFVDALGYSPGPSLDNLAATELRQALTEWLDSAHLTAEDAIVIYYSGHGYLDPTGHYLYTKGFHKDAVADGMRSHALVELVLGRKARPGKLWLILDCCHAGGVLVADLYREIVVSHTDTFVLAASRSYGQAGDGVFSVAFHEAARTLGQGTSLDRITGAINASLNKVRRGSRAVQLSFSSREFDFLEDCRPRAFPPILPSSLRI